MFIFISLHSVSCLPLLSHFVFHISLHSLSSPDPSFTMLLFLSATFAYSFLYPPPSGNADDISPPSVRNAFLISNK